MRHAARHPVAATHKYQKHNAVQNFYLVSPGDQNYSLIFSSLPVFFFPYVCCSANNGSSHQIKWLRQSKVVKVAFILQRKFKRQYRQQALSYAKAFLNIVYVPAAVRGSCSICLSFIAPDMPSCASGVPTVKPKPLFC